MARILYGVHSTGHGHAMHGLAVARHYPQHEFQFVCHGQVAELLRTAGFRVFECPNPTTPVIDHRARFVSAALRTSITLAEGGHWTRKLLRAAEDFKPDVAITDYEYFVPRVASRCGLPCLSLDMIHSIVFGQIEFPPTATLNWKATCLAIRLLFSAADEYFVTCFFEAPLRPNHRAVRWSGPLLRDDVRRRHSTNGNHVVAYQGYTTFPAFTEVLRQIRRPVHVYGLGDHGRDGNLIFKTSNERSFFDDLASAAYVICGGGHTLISEALHLGKPVLSIPIRGLFEQFINAHYVERSGYGRRATSATFSLELIRDFERQLDSFAKRIGERRFCGNDTIFAALDDFIGAARRAPQTQLAPRPRYSAGCAASTSIDQ